jgi:GTP pyrophosphokinase
MAAHFDYKEKGSKISTDIDWVHDLKELTENLENNDFMDSLKIDIFKDRIFLLTPK